MAAIISESKTYTPADFSSKTDEKAFRRRFSALRTSNPQEAAEACLWYIASNGLDATGKDAAFFLTLQNRYLTTLFASTSIPNEIALKALTLMKEADPQFFSNFIRVASSLNSATEIVQALNLLTSMGDYSVFLPWLRSLANHSEERVRAQATKLVCKVQPKADMIDRQLRSPDARVRADAVESLWGSQTAEAKQLFLKAKLDDNHRVIVNALVGLHLLHDPNAIDQLQKFVSHPDPFFRAAAAWGLAHIGALSAIPQITDLANDSSALVRKRAVKSLDKLRASGKR